VGGQGRAGEQAAERRHKQRLPIDDQRLYQVRELRNRSAA
jgi:hypothetical protein